MSPLIAVLYVLCIFTLTGFGVFVIVKNYTAPLNRYFAGLCLALLGWVASLFAFAVRTSPSELLFIGRLNFASVVVVTTLVFLFVRQLSRRPVRNVTWIWLETIVFTLATLLLPVVDRAEFVTNGVHTTAYGQLFLVYLVHVLGFTGAGVIAALRPPGWATKIERNQLAVVGFGILATSAVALVTNVVLPYAFDNFGYIHIGTISTCLFLAATGYAVFVYGLFDFHVVIRATFVYGGLIALALEFYRASIAFLIHLLPLGSASDDASAAALITLVLYSFTQDSVKHLLDQVARRLFRHHNAHS